MLFHVLLRLFIKNTIHELTRCNIGALKQSTAEIGLGKSCGTDMVIADLKATVKVDGRITVDGRGLVFGGGNTVGISLAPPATAFNVFATLICETAAPFTQFSTNAVPLPADGDFRIDDVLSPLPPSSCASPVLLIRESVGQTWFAAGIPKI